MNEATTVTASGTGPNPQNIDKPTPTPQPSPHVNVITQTVTTQIKESTKKNVITTIDTKLIGQLIYDEVKGCNFCVEQHDDHYIEMLYQQSGGIPTNIGPKLKKAIDEIAQFRKLTPINIMINRLPAGKKVDMHRDWLKPTPLQPQLPVIERWHLVLVTNKDAKYYDKVNGEMNFTTGKWYGPIPYWCEHKVENGGTTERVHLIVDLDTPEPISNYGYED